ncbi:MAG: glycogen debranching N-terminal domain-containing protein [Ilumatobacteraceae bacterium]
MSSTGGSPYAGTQPVATGTLPTSTVTLVEGRTFCLSDFTGDMAADLPQGVFVLDTRIISRWRLSIDDHRIEPLATSSPEPFSATFVGRSRATVGQADSHLVVFRYRDVGQGMRERIVLTNHGLEPAQVRVRLDCDADFAELFAVKESRVHSRGRHTHQPGPDLLRFHWAHKGLTRDVEVHSSRPASVGAGSFVWDVELGPGASWEVCLEVTASFDTERLTPTFAGARPVSAGTAAGHSRASPLQRLADWRAMVPVVTSDDERLDQTVRRCREDLGALRIFDPDHPDLPIVAAGAPWFMTVFGRDSLLTAWMALIADTSLAHGVLATLARFQGVQTDAATEEEPGKILHEMRFDEATTASLGHGSVYYGSIDATPLFVMLLGELRRWDPRDELVDQLLPHADRAMQWIEQYGDRDGDGYVEYERLNPHGLANQGWKDSWDSIRHLDGQLAEGPIALCEVQGYVHAAYLARAHFAWETGDHATFQRCCARAAELRRRFDEDFWDDEHGWFALGLDGDKRRINTLASNVGHCLWTGIVEPDKAALVARRLLSPAMFTGYGIRTLATTMPSYNPISYHNGSVWPHDNAICAAGLARYGFIEEAGRIISGQLEVARANDGRLPELFAGFDSGALGVPVPFPTSCSPQAWAAASPLLWLRTLLRLDPVAAEGRLWLDPWRPDGIDELQVTGIRVGRSTIDVHVDRDGAQLSGADQLDVTFAPKPHLSETGADPGRPLGHTSSPPSCGRAGTT